MVQQLLKSSPAPARKARANDPEWNAVAIRAEISIWDRTVVETAGSDPMAWLDDLVRYAFSQIGSVDEAEDVAMDTIAAISEMGKKWDRVQDKRLYCFGIARRKVADRLRRKVREKRYAESVAESPVAEDMDRRDAIWSVLQKLPEPQRHVLVLKYIHGFSAEEIGDIVGRSVAAVNSLLQRGREGFQREGAGLFSNQEVNANG